MPRLTHDQYFMTIAKAVSLRSVCQSRQIGAVLVDENNHILSTGYNGAASGVPECSPCKRLDVPSGLGLDGCMAVHAEANALLQCGDVRLIHTLYVTVSPCFNCLKMLLNTRCMHVVFLNSYPHPESELTWIEMGRRWTRVHYPTKVRGILESLSKMSKYLI
jgi:dCMP deaminase